MLNKLLEKYIPSKYYLNYLKKNDISFSDYEVAAILSNINSNPFELNEVLEKLAKNSKNNKLKKQIKRKIEKDNHLFALLKDNSNKDAIYVLKIKDDNEYDIAGFFIDYEIAYSKALELNSEFVIEKQRVHDDKNIEKTVHYIYPNPYIFEDAKVETYIDDTYEEELAYFRYNKEGSIQYFYVKDNIDKEKELLDEVYDPDYFENAYMYLPFPFEYGDIIYDVKENKKGIIEQTLEDYKNIQKKVRKGMYADSFDAGTIVSYLQDDGRFIHDHPLPFFLEKYEPKKTDDDYDLLNCASHLLKQDCSLDFFTSIYEDYRNKRLK